MSVGADVNADVAFACALSSAQNIRRTPARRLHNPARQVLSSARDLLQRLIAKEEAAQAAQEAAERAAQALRLAMERSNVEDRSSFLLLVLL